MSSPTRSPASTSMHDLTTSSGSAGLASTGGTTSGTTSNPGATGGTDRARSRAPRFPALALAAFVGLGLAACGGESDTDGTADSGPAQAQSGTAQSGTDQVIPGQSPQDPMGQMDPESMALVMEAQQIQQRLGTIGQQVMEDPVVAQQLESLQESVETAMREEAPDLVAQMDAFQAEHAAATASGDRERAQQIEFEAREAQAELQRVQQVVFERPAIAAAIAAFEENQRERMIAIDPEAGELMDRLEEIRAELGMP